jgi:Core-2/I-Branching enzyme
MSPAPIVAYLINSETSPERLIRLATVIRAGSPRGAIAVRHDDAGGALELRRLHELEVDLLETTSVERGSASELMMLLRCIRRLRESARFDWLVLISGDDYPVRPIAEIETTLAGANTDGFVETHRCEPPASRRGAPVEEHTLRYHYRWSSARRSRPLGRALAGVLSPHVVVATTPAGVRIGVPAKRSPFKPPRGKRWALPVRHNPLSTVEAERAPFGEGLECHYGSRSFVLSRRAVELTDAAVRDHPELVLYYRDTLVPAESYIHTVLANDSTISLRNEGRRRELNGAVDVDALLACGADFAGPLDPDSPLLDAIDARVHRA